MNAIARRALLAAFVAIVPAAFAQFPSKPIRIVIPYQPGSGSGLDAVVRLIGQEMSASLQQPVVVEYKPGASTTIGAAAVVAAPADGHSLFLNAQSFLITAQLMSRLPYDPKQDFVPVTSLLANPHVLVVGVESPHRSAKAFIDAARSHGKNMSYASFGNASSGHLAFESLKKTFAFRMVHIPYKGSEGMSDVMAGRVDGMLADLPSAQSHGMAGRLQLLAVASEQRDPSAPNVPTFAEATGTPFVSRSWFGLLARAGTPPDVIATLNREVLAAMAKPHVAERIRAAGYQALPSTPEAFAAFMGRERRRIAEAIEFSGARME